MLSTQFEAVTSAPWFAASWSPYALLDRDLRIRAVNAAFELVTRQPRAAVVGRPAREAFPRNPADPQATVTSRFEHSMETVLHTATKQWSDIHRHDVLHPDLPGEFIFKVWLQLDVPVFEDGRVVGVLHHVQDVTAVASSAEEEIRLTGEHTSALDRAAEDLQGLFPDAATPQVLGLLTDSLCVILEAARPPRHRGSHEARPAPPRAGDASSAWDPDQRSSQGCLDTEVGRVDDPVREEGRAQGPCVISWWRSSLHLAGQGRKP